MGPCSLNDCEPQVARPSTWRASVRAGRAGRDVGLSSTHVESKGNETKLKRVEIELNQICAGCLASHEGREREREAYDLIKGGKNK